MDFLEKRGIYIKNERLLKTALTHSSYSNEHDCDNYERLEFLGDAVLELVTSDYLYTFTNNNEGMMTKIRSNYVCEKALATYAKKMGMDKCIRLGHGQASNLNDTIIADVFEAVAAAVYLDQGYEIVKKYLDSIIIPHIKNGDDFNTDYKTKLQEIVQTGRKSVVYEVVNEYGKAHNKTFDVIVKIDDIVYGKGTGKSKKEAEQHAALDALNKSVR